MLPWLIAGWFGDEEGSSTKARQPMLGTAREMSNRERPGKVVQRGLDLLSSVLPVIHHSCFGVNRFSVSCTGVLSS